MARLRRASPRAWIGTALSLLLLSSGAFVGYEWHKARRRPPPAPTRAVLDSAPSTSTHGRDLLNARDPAERRDRTAAIRSGGDAALAELVRALDEANPAQFASRPANLRDAIALAAELASDASGRAPETRERLGAALERLCTAPPFRDDALRARARLGDSRAARDVGDLWLRELRSERFVSRLSALALENADGAYSPALRAMERRLRAASGALQALASAEDSGVMERLLESYWASWAWLGQTRGEGFTAALWELAKPPNSVDADFKERVRAARRVVERGAKGASASVRAAAGLILLHSGPQFQTVKREIIASLAAMLPECAPPEAQRVTWTLSQLSGRSFAGMSPDAAPVDVSAAAVDAAITWAVADFGAKPPTRRLTPSALPSPPVVASRVVTPRRQLQVELARRMSQGWSGLAASLNDWRREKLGWSPEMREALHPGRRDTPPAMICAAILLAAETSPPDSRAMMSLWRDAADQPAWVRGMAVCALGALDARSGKWESGFPTGLSDDAFADADGGAPSWALWGDLLAVAGKPAIDRLSGSRPASLSRQNSDRLLREAARAMEARRAAEKPR